MKPSRKHSMTSQLVMMIVVTVIIMQIYAFFRFWTILDLFSALTNMIIGAYFQKSISLDPNSNKDESQQTGE